MKKTLLLIFFSVGLVASSLAQISQSKESIFNLLTGGTVNPTGKKWKISPFPNKTGMGPVTTLDQSYWTYNQGLIETCFTEGLLNNDYTFRKDSTYIPKNQNVTVHWAHANVYFGKNQAQFVDLALQDPKHTAAPFKLKKMEGSPGTGFILDVQNGSYLGYFQNRSRYEIIKITEDSMYVRQAFSEDPSTDPKLDEIVRYFTFVADKPDPQRDTYISLLTGGFVGSQTWVISPSPFKSGLGPATSTQSLYYNYPDGLPYKAWINGALANDYTFSSTGQYTPKNNKVTVLSSIANAYFGATQAKYDDAALVDPLHTSAPFEIEKSVSPIGTGYQLLIRNSSYIGYAAKRNNYQIMAINKDSVRLRVTYSDGGSLDVLKDSLARYFTLVKGFLVTSLQKGLAHSSFFTFYPNPAKDVVTLHEEVSSAHVYSATGDLLLKGEGAQLNIVTLPTGLYLVKVQYKDGEVSWQKLLKE